MEVAAVMVAVAVIRAGAIHKMYADKETAKVNAGVGRDFGGSLLLILE